MEYLIDGEGQNYSNSRVLGYGRLESCTRPCAKVVNNLTKFKKVYHYTKGSVWRWGIDQEGLWSVFQESVDYNLEVLKNKLLQPRYRDVF